MGIVDEAAKALAKVRSGCGDVQKAAPIDYWGAVAVLRVLRSADDAMLLHNNDPDRAEFHWQRMLDVALEEYEQGPDI